MKKIIFLDRDGTINKDENYYLGANPDWKSQVGFLPGVIEGIRRINQSGLDIFILTNQSGVALKGIDPKTGINFDNLNEERMHEVNQHIIQRLNGEGALVTGYFACPFVDQAYKEKSKSKGRSIDSRYVQNKHPDLKPNSGMINKAILSLGDNVNEFYPIMIGDRASDVEMGLNANGTGILVSSPKTVELGDIEKFEYLGKKFGKRIYLANNFLDAVDYSLNLEIP